ncbi:hypothetical protein B0H34DRAFT_674009 [Crassisporium funariophilum]|nr:hypothetical protein B0H34DRAFT_674009 [Crassisporium funariophilum]
MSMAALAKKTLKVFQGGYKGEQTQEDVQKETRGSVEEASRLPFLPETRAKKVDKQSLTKDDIIIVVMGQPRSGKTTFINIACGLNTKSPNSVPYQRTSTIDLFKISFPDGHRDVVLVDTPGIDQGNQQKISKMITDWLGDRYKEDISLSGLVYFHPISEEGSKPRLKHLNKFKKYDASANLVLATTMWGQTDEKAALAQEKELERNYWRPMLDRGCSSDRFMGTRESAFSLLSSLIYKPTSGQSAISQNYKVDSQGSSPEPTKMEFSHRTSYDNTSQKSVNHQEEMGEGLKTSVTKTDLHEREAVSENRGKRLGFTQDPPVPQTAELSERTSQGGTGQQSAISPSRVVNAQESPQGLKKQSPKRGSINATLHDTGIAQNDIVKAQESSGPTNGQSSKHGITTGHSTPLPKSAPSLSPSTNNANSRQSNVLQKPESLATPQVEMGDLREKLPRSATLGSQPTEVLPSSTTGHSMLLPKPASSLSAPLTNNANPRQSNVLQKPESLASSAPQVATVDLRARSGTLGSQSIEVLPSSTTVHSMPLPKPASSVSAPLTGNANSRQSKEKRGSLTSSAPQEATVDLRVRSETLGIQTTEILPSSTTGHSMSLPKPASSLSAPMTGNANSRQLNVLHKPESLASSAPQVAMVDLRAKSEALGSQPTEAFPSSSAPKRREESRRRGGQSQSVGQNDMAGSITGEKANRLSFLMGSQARKVETNELTPNDIIIVLMGRAGSGKTTFINIVTGLNSKTSNSISPSTSTNTINLFKIPSTDGLRDVIFVDTPGIDNANESKISKMITDWLRDRYKDDILLSGLVYFHPISDRASKPLLRHLNNFKEYDISANVVLATTMWDQVDEEKGSAQEKHLEGNYWRPMLDRGCTSGRFMGTRESAFSLLAPLIDMANRGKIRLSVLSGAVAKKVEKEDLTKNDVIIAVMGPTGAGKSTFIKLATGLDTGIGHSLESCTSTIDTIKLSFPQYSDCDVVFVDTPGFDDTNKSDADILEMIAAWLKETFQKEILLSGLVYFHRISDNRMAGTPLKNLRMFKELCGQNALNNIILVTTMWDEVDEATGAAREKELKENYWRAMIEGKSTTARFEGTRQSALTLLSPLIDRANAQQAVLLQDEMVQYGKELRETSAGQALYSKMEDLVRQRKFVLEQIRKEMKREKGHLKDGEEASASLSVLMDEYQELKTQLDSAFEDMRKMKLTFGQRFMSMATSTFSFKPRFKLNY